LGVGRSKRACASSLHKTVRVIHPAAGDEPGHSKRAFVSLMDLIIWRSVALNELFNRNERQ
jgi:hypothetical protein